MLFSSCGKNESYPVCCVLPFESFVGYEVNGTIKYADVAYHKIGTDSLEISATNLNSKLSIHVKYTGSNTYILKGNQAQIAVNNASGENTIWYHARLDTSSKVKIIVTDSASNMIAGKFKLKLNRVSAVAPNYPDTVSITNGRFQFKLTN